MSEPVLLVPKPPDLAIVHDPAREAATRGVRAYTLAIDGVPSLMWFPTAHAAERCAARLKLGRSGEAFGGSGVAGTPGQSVAAAARGRDKKGRGRVERSGGEVATETTTTKSGKAKVREARPGFVYTLDGGDAVHAASEADAKMLCAVEAFRTRGKLNPARHREAEAAFRDQKRKDCRVHQVGANVVAKDADGLLWLTRFDAESGDWRFKILGQK